MIAKLNPWIVTVVLIAASAALYWGFRSGSSTAEQGPHKTLVASSTLAQTTPSPLPKGKTKTVTIPSTDGIYLFSGDKVVKLTGPARYVVLKDGGILCLDDRPCPKPSDLPKAKAYWHDNKFSKPSSRKVEGGLEIWP